ncbi:MAG: DHH family phosphoesterase, partial [Blautia sp.]|nr:DHH family phosphoesterase [Blautia sp.]
MSTFPAPSSSFSTSSFTAPPFLKPSDPSILAFSHLVPSLSLLESLQRKEEPIYILAHKNPDADAICSALVLESFLSRLNMPARAALPSAPQGEGAFVLSYLQEKDPMLLTKAQGKHLFLVDHSSYAHALPDLVEGKVIGILDHHPGGDVRVEKDAFLCCHPAGSTCSLLSVLYEKAGILPSQREASLLLAGLLADTRRLTLNVTPLDLAVHERLLPLSGIHELSFYEDMRRAASLYGGMNDREIFLSDYKTYTPCSLSLGVAVVQVL